MHKNFQTHCTVEASEEETWTFFQKSFQKWQHSESYLSESRALYFRHYARAPENSEHRRLGTSPSEQTALKDRTSEAELYWPCPDEYTWAL